MVPSAPRAGYEDKPCMGRMSLVPLSGRGAPGRHLLPGSNRFPGSERNERARERASERRARIRAVRPVAGGGRGRRVACSWNWTPLSSARVSLFVQLPSARYMCARHSGCSLPGGRRWPPTVRAAQQWRSWRVRRWGNPALKTRHGSGVRYNIRRYSFHLSYYNLVFWRTLRYNDDLFNEHGYCPKEHYTRA